ncbi:MAG: DUF1553 domain-containing protein [Fuerstiella sp.]
MNRTACYLSLCWCFAASVSPAADTPDFSRDVLPILSDKCFVCHGPDAAELGEDMRRLDSFDAATERTDSGRAIDPERPERSLVLQRIHSADDPMPPADAEKQLTNEERDILTRWTKAGGQYKQHWAFVAPRRPRPQTDPDADGAKAIDAFIADRLKQQNVTFAEEADRRTLARRASLVLTGLPPEPEELQTFLNDDDSGAYERYVDRLMGQPGFGEHQARYWLDAVRYGDTHGLHLDNRRGIFPYRDWVVRAFNRNLPLDDFITWQLAGDLLPNPTPEQLIATGFVRMNPTTSEGGVIPAEFQAKNNFDRTETLGTVLLGMSLTCARCHTHKYDPITHKEYYQLFAFFNNTAEPALDGNKYEFGPTLKVPVDQPMWQQWDQLLRERDRLLKEITTDLPPNDDAADDWKAKSPTDQLKDVAEQRPPFQQSEHSATAKQLQQSLAELEKQFTTTLVARELPKPRETKVLRRGEYNLPIGDPLRPDVPKVMGELAADASRDRLGLARWLTSKDHPLVARVLVNRLWQRVFGYGLVRTPEDFGVQGRYPTHPELMDWLAVELHESGWDLKHMLRLMVTSKTFRQSSAWRNDFPDPENRFFARASSYRLDAEVLRDIGLWASDLLDPHMGGEGVKPYQPAGMWLAMAHPASNTKKYERDSGRRLYRRSLYVYWKRTSPHPMMTLFDAPDRESSCVRRSRTNTSLQSLGLLNETQRVEMARKLSERLLTSRDSDPDRLQLAFTLLCSRPPDETEIRVCRQLLDSALRRYQDHPAEANELLATGESKTDADLDPVTLAAWTQVTSTLLASDAAILLY